MTNQNIHHDAHRKSVGEWISQNYEWRIPVYQRHYAWDATDDAGPVHLFWGTVEEQTNDRLMNKTPNPHYLGVVLVDNKTDHGVAHTITHYNVVDGQQRLTTIQIALLALINAAEECNCGSKFRDELKKYLFSDADNLKPRLNPTNFDNQQFRTILFQTFGELPELDKQNATKENANKSKIVATGDYFKETFIEFVKNRAGENPETVIDCLKDTLLHGFDFILIVLRSSDNAQLIFESLNNYAKPLTTFDLIRNNIFYRAAEKTSGADVALFNHNIWQQLETVYWEKKSDNKKVNSNTHIENYIFRMLITNIKDEIRLNRNDIFKTYKKFSERFTSIEEEVQELTRYVKIYTTLDSPSADNLLPINYGIFYYPIWQNREFYPVIFSIVGSNASDEEKQTMIKLLESYVIRRSVCGFNTKAYNKHAVSFCKKLGNNVNYDSLLNILQEGTGDSVLHPSDKTIMERSVYANFYSSTLPQYVLKKIEISIQDAAERGDFGQLTIDHLIPQGWENEQKWVDMLSEEDPNTIEIYLNTIGNLTLMSGPNNTKKSNRPWNEAQKLLSASPMKLNRDIAREDDWNTKKIRERSKMLAEKICELWPYDIPRR